MDLQILKEKDMPLLSRNRISATVSFSGSRTPSNVDLRLALAKMLKADVKLVAIRHIYQQFGAGSAKVIAHVYKDEATMKSLEKASKVKLEEPKAEEKPVEEAKPVEQPPKEEAPKAEEVKEEAKDGKEESKE